MVLGLLVEDPRTIHHHTGVELTDLEDLVNRWAILNTLRCVAFKILFVIESDLPGLSIYLERVKELKLMKVRYYLISELFMDVPGFTLSSNLQVGVFVLESLSNCLLSLFFCLLAFD